MKKILCVMFGFAIGVMVGLLCYRLRNEENGETRKTLTAFGYI